MNSEPGNLFANTQLDKELPAAKQQKNSCELKYSQSVVSGTVNKSGSEVMHDRQKSSESFESKSGVIFRFGPDGVLQEHAPDADIAGEQQQRVPLPSGQHHDGGRLQQDDGEGDDQHGDEPHRSGPGQVQHRGRAQPGTRDSSASKKGKRVVGFLFFL